MSETMTDDSDLLARISGYLAARPQYARTFYADHPEVMLKEAADRIKALEAELAQEREGADGNERRWQETVSRNMELRDGLAKLRAENEQMRTVFRVNMLRAFPDKTHAEIDAEIAATLTPPSPEVR